MQRDNVIQLKSGWKQVFTNITSPSLLASDNFAFACAPCTMNSVWRLHDTISVLIHRKHVARIAEKSDSDQCPETVRKPSTHRTTSGRFPDIAIFEVRKSSTSPTPSGRLPDFMSEVTRFVNQIVISSGSRLRSRMFGAGSWLCRDRNLVDEPRHFGHEVRKSSTWGRGSGRFPDFENGNVRKPSGSRPVGGRFPDGFRTLVDKDLPNLQPNLHRPQKWQCPETVRKPSGAQVQWTTSGRFPDIAIFEVRKSSTSPTPSGRLPDFMSEVTRFVTASVNSQ